MSSPPPPIASIYETEDDLTPVRVAQSWLPTQDRPAPPPLPPVPLAKKPESPPAKTAEPFRPTQRPPVAFLTVCDDGRTDGELIRLRAERFTIGRNTGDLLLPHDEQVSGRHVEITRQAGPGGWRWVVTDLQSTNGLFVRVSRAALSDRVEFLVGSGRYRFEAEVGPGNTVDYQPDAPSGSTRGWAIETASSPPALVELVPGGIGNRYVLTRPEYWIGTDSACAVARPDDPFCEPRHARVHRDGIGGWHVEHKKTTNGLWLRVPQIVAGKGCVFQIGEQRFRLVVEQ